MTETELEPGTKLIPEETCDHPEDQREYTNLEEPFCLLCYHIFTEDEYLDKYL
jgi:hypothetical protein